MKNNSKNISNIVFKPASVTSKDAQAMLSELSDTLTKLIGHDGAMHVNLDDFRQERSIFIVGYDDGVPCSCAAIRNVSEDTGEVKRVYARKNSKGIASKLMQFIENWAAEDGYSRLILECRPNNPHAIEFYKKCGYTVCKNFPPYDTDTYAVCMEKPLA